MDPQATESLRSFIVDTLDQYNKTVDEDSKFDQKLNISKLDSAVIASRLKSILNDGKIYRIEAPKLFDDLKKITGSDDQLSPEEAKAYEPLLTDRLWSLVTDITRAGIADYMAILLGKPSSADEKLIDTDGFIKRQIEKMFEPADEKELEKIVADIKVAEDRLNEEIEYLEGRINGLREDEVSFWNYVSAENTLGLSGWMPTYWNMLWNEEETNDCNTLSSAEFDGARDVLKKFYSIQAGLRIMKGGIIAGQVIEKGEFVQEFLQSPFADIASIKKNLGLTETCTIVSGAIALDIFRVNEAVKYNATRLAVAYAEASVFTENDY